MSPLARTPSPTSVSPSHSHAHGHQPRSTSPLTLRGSPASPHLATITPQTSPRPGSPLLRRALSPDHFHLSKHDKKTEFRRKTSRDERSLGRQDSFERKGRHHRRHDTVYQAVRCVVEHESPLERPRSVSLNETKSPNKLELKCELRRHSEQPPKILSNLKLEPRGNSGEKLDETDLDTRFWRLAVNYQESNNGELRWISSTGWSNFCGLSVVFRNCNGFISLYSVIGWKKNSCQPLNQSDAKNLNQLHRGQVQFSALKLFWVRFTTKKFSIPKDRLPCRYCKYL